MNGLVLLLIIPICRFLININHWNYFRRVIKKHDEWLEGLSDSCSPETKKNAQKAGEWIQAQTSEISRVYALTGKTPPYEAVMEPAGYGHLQSKKLNILDNLLFQNSDVLQRGRTALHVAKGHFLTHAKLSLNPLYWLEVVFFLPSFIVSASGIEITNKVAEVGVKIVQIIYWLAVAIAIYLNPELLKVLVNHASA